jgi:hypothetical protein
MEDTNILYQTEYPLETSSAHHVATLAGLKIHRKDHTTTGSRKTAPGSLGYTGSLQVDS